LTATGRNPRYMLQGVCVLRLSAAQTQQVSRWCLPGSMWKATHLRALAPSGFGCGWEEEEEEEEVLAAIAPSPHAADPPWSGAAGWVGKPERLPKPASRSSVVFIVCT
jgi:hypothetical protein